MEPFRVPKAYTRWKPKRGIVIIFFRANDYAVAKEILVHFLKSLAGLLSSVGPEILAFVSHCSANFKPILDCFIQNFKLKYKDLENIKEDCVNVVFFNLR